MTAGGKRRRRPMEAAMPHAERTAFDEVEITMAIKENSAPVRGSGDFLKDMGYDDPEETRLKFTLANAIALAIEDRGMSQIEAASIAGIDQADVSQISNGAVAGRSIFSLMRVLTAFGKDISISIADSKSERGIIGAGMVADGDV